MRNAVPGVARYQREGVRIFLRSDCHRSQIGVDALSICPAARPTGMTEERRQIEPSSAIAGKDNAAGIQSPGRSGAVTSAVGRLNASGRWSGALVRIYATPALSAADDVGEHALVRRETTGLASSAACCR